jgi:hypothetical protein
LKTSIAILVVLLLAVIATAAEKPRVFVTDSQSWEVGGGTGGSGGAFGGSAKGGARPQTAEIIKTFGERCPDVTVNNRKERSDYVVVLDHEGGKSLLRKDNKVAVFNGDGDSILSRSTRSLGSSVTEACNAIKADWPKRSMAREADPASSDQSAATSKAPEFSGAKVQVSSEPSGADIEIDGNFVGNTPSAVDLAAGDHVIMVKKTGYKDWQRKIKTTAGAVTISAALEKNQ